jgi:hypothetical protein
MPNNNAAKTARVNNTTFRSEVIDMDNKHFFGCAFVNCALRYAGGKTSWDENTVLDGCAWEPLGNSNNVKNVLDTFGVGRFTLKNKSFSI